MTVSNNNNDNWKEEWKKKSEEDYESLLELIHEPTLKSLGQVADMFLESRTILYKSGCNGFYVLVMKVGFTLS